MNPYLADILSQPQALRLALKHSDFSSLEPLCKALDGGRYGRLILTGMGASFYALYPAWLRLASTGLPALWVDTAELIHHAPALLDGATLLWVASQSGRSAEVASLVRHAAQRGVAALMALSNAPDSPLGKAAQEWENGWLLLLHAQPEATVSTRTYLNTLALAQLAAQALLTGADVTDLVHILSAAAEAIEIYLEQRAGILEQIDGFLEGLPPDFPPTIALIGRGSSLASALCGALYLQEAAKTPALGFQAGEFRHGPLEMASPRMGAWVFAGEPGSSAWGLNLKLWQYLQELGVNARLLDVSRKKGGEEGRSSIDLPQASGIGLPLAEIIPVQLLSYRLAERLGITPGAFRHIGKVTLEE